MKQIGIKLADGTFYPIMEDGKPGNKDLGLTTVRDNQTRIIVDLYRSNTGTMEDAEYIDSLQIDNLKEHPNGSMDIPLKIQLDESGKLSADMNDPETGASSNANITLVSRTLEERLEPTNYDVKMEEEEFEIPDTVSEDEITPEEKSGSNAGSVAAGVAAGAVGGGLLARMLAKQNEKTAETKEASPSDETVADYTAEGDTFDSDTLSENEEAFTENVPDETTFSEDADGTSFTEENFAGDALAGDTFASDTLTEDADNASFTEDGLDGDSLEGDIFDSDSLTENGDTLTENAADDSTFDSDTLSENAPDETSLSDDTPESEALSGAMASKADALKGMGDDVEYEEPSSEDFGANDLDNPDTTGLDGFDSTEPASETSDMGGLDDSLDLSLPDFNDDETVSPEGNEASSDDTTVSEDTVTDAGDSDLPPLEDFNLDEPLEDPFDADKTVAEDTADDTTLSGDDFGTSETEDTIASDDTLTSDDFSLPEDDTLSSEDTNFDGEEFSLPDFPQDDETTMNDDDFLNSIDNDNINDATNDMNSTIPAAGGLDFDGLYDKETEEGTPYQNEEDDVRKKTKAPVIICVICAIICILAVILLLLIVPSKYNLLGKRPQKAEKPVVEKVEPEVPEVEPETEPEPEIPDTSAKEDEIVVITEPEIVETVVPEVPKEPETPKDITYKIKWGDTLWDIADAYYKNPWKYHMIAKYNGIKNPDHIISGTTIKLPQK